MTEPNQNAATLIDETLNLVNDLDSVLGDLENAWDDESHGERMTYLREAEALVKKLPGRIASLMALSQPDAAKPERSCHACTYCFMEPSDMNFTCGHPDAGVFGKSINIAAGPDGHCGPKRPKFEQHPKRTPDGRLN